MKIKDGPYFDYPNEPIGGSNPYYRCCACGISDPQINGTLTGHGGKCSWVREKFKSLGVPEKVCRVEVRESDRFMGQKTDHVREFYNQVLADWFVEDYNKDNNEPVTPEWYMVAIPLYK